MKTEIHLLYFNKTHIRNFGDQLSPFVVSCLLDKNQYGLTFKPSCSSLHLVAIGSYLHMAPDKCVVFGTGVRTVPPVEGGHSYKTLDVRAVRGPLTRAFLESKNIQVPPVYGDPALLLPLFYTPTILEECAGKTAVVPHYTQYRLYQNKGLDPDIYHLVNPCDNWQHVINQIVSCRRVLSSSLHGLICSDAYGKPNCWLHEFPLNEGEFKFHDYFLSQGRPSTFVKEPCDNDSLFYDKGNTLDLDILRQAFPFS
jgi:pyruvyltransferase